MHLEVLSEDRSGGILLNHLLHSILKNRRVHHTYAIRPHRGKGNEPVNPMKRPAKFASSLLDLLPAKLRAYASTGQPDQLLLVIVVDADADDPQAVQLVLENLVIRFGRDIGAVIGICVEEIEAWILGDPQAILAAYPDADLQKAVVYRQDSVCGTWEILAQVLAGNQADQVIRIGYPAVGQLKGEWSGRIGPHMDPDRNRSPSFQRFYRALTRHLQSKEDHHV